jgi:ketosteroid isomerase-like protein
MTYGPRDTDPVDTVRAWHDAVNAGDVERLVALSSDDVEVGGPRGSGRGARLLQEWFARAGIRLDARLIFRRDRTVVVEQSAAWHMAGSGDSAEPQTIASVFLVEDGRVASVTRYADLASALEAAGLTDADRI